VLAASALVWLMSVALFVVGIICCLIRTQRRMGLFMVGGSFLVWFLSMGMLAVAPQPRSDAPPKARQDLAAAPPLEPGASRAAASAPAASAPAPKPSKGKWTGGSQGASAMDDTKTVAYTLDAENEISGWLDHDRPTLVVRCHERKTNAYVDVGMPAQPELGEYQRHTVRLRFDDEPAASQLWQQSTDGEGLFSPSGVTFAKRLAKTKRLRLQFIPFNSNPQVIEFDTAGFDQVIGEIAQPCGWKP
jgi:hypothetical protein